MSNEVTPFTIQELLKKITTSFPFTKGIMLGERSKLTNSFKTFGIMPQKMRIKIITSVLW